MIIKSLPRKSHSFGQLLQYIDAPEQTGEALMHNLRSDANNLAEIHGEFLENARLLPPRKNGNLLYHEVISFSDHDRERVTPEMLHNVGRHYLERRAPYALAYGRVHLDTENPHLHLMISANNFGSSQRLRLSRGDFARIKQEMEAYQRERHPELSASRVEHERTNSPTRRSEAELNRRLRHEGRKTSKKDLIKRAFLHELSRNRSGEDFAKGLSQAGLRIYRRGRSVAVEDMSSGRRYRLTTLGVDDALSEALDGWKKLPERLGVLRTVDREQELRKEQERNRSP